ncbi:unnamed protein product [Rotaria socialis]|uniref:G-protein coupled receptors family 1 profile domain-containing protein n=1 Tax=Rotaria socialis TaxID=392032 RepID=A0A820UUR7_9BILA|nr:unnamed protein product [Rotaria socialis]
MNNTGPLSPGAPVLTPLESNIALYGYTLLYIIGIFGHTNSFLIFLRPTLRRVSTSCLFVALTFSDSIYFLVSIYNFINIGLKEPDRSADPSATCRLRTFVQSTFMFCNAWLLVTIAVDRWARVRFPLKSKEVCTRRNALVATVGILMVAIGLNSPFVVPQLFGRLPAGIMTVCGANMADHAYFQFFRHIWPILFSCIQTFLPVILLLMFSLDTFRRLAKQSAIQGETRARTRRAYLDKQILLIMLTTIILFLITSLPVSLYNILQPTILPSLMTQSQQLELFSIFTFVVTTNYTINFYLHCLTSTLFRQELIQAMKCGRKSGQVVPTTASIQMTNPLPTLRQILNCDVSLANALPTNLLPSQMSCLTEIEPSIDLSVDHLLWDSNIFDEHDFFDKNNLADSSMDSYILDSIQELLTSGCDLFDQPTDSVQMPENKTTILNASNTNSNLPFVFVPDKTTESNSTDSEQDECNRRDPKANSATIETWTRFGNRKVIKYSEEYRIRRLDNNRAVQKARQKAKEKDKAKKLKMSILINQNQRLTSRVDQLTKALESLKAACEELTRGSSIDSS